jgi:hypothetical protein
MSEIVYVLTNPAIPDLVKVLRTTNLEERVRSLSSHSGYPFLLRKYACVVNDSSKVEKDIHGGFGDHRVNPRRKFAIDLSEGTLGAFEGEELRKSNGWMIG